MAAKISFYGDCVGKLLAMGYKAWQAGDKI